MDELLSHIQHFHFLRPYWLLVAIPLVLVIKLLDVRDNMLSQWQGLMSAEILQQLTIKGNQDQWFSPRKFLWLFIPPLCLLLAGPVWHQKASPFSEDQSPLIIALDVSKSMEQTDIQPSRLLRAKQKIIELMALRGDAKTALIAYSGSAHIVMPITNDTEMIRHFLDVLNRKLLPTAGKNIKAVLPEAEVLLQPIKVPATLLILTDGASTDAMPYFADFFNQSHQLIVWAFGRDLNNDASDSLDNDSLDSPSADTRMSKTAIIPVQLAQLQNLTDTSSGRLIKMTHDKDDVELVNSAIKNNLVVVDDNGRPWHEESYPLIFVIAFIYLFWFRRGWSLQW